MKEKYLTKRNYVYCYYARSYIGRFLLFVPTVSVFSLIGFWENLDFIWIAPLCGGIGWFLLLSLNYGKILPSKKCVALHVLYAGLMAGAHLCAVLIFIQYFALLHALERPNPEIQKKIPTQFEPTTRDFSPEYLEQLQLQIDELQLLLEDAKINERENS